MKPEWKDAPPWAHWLAMDANGRYWWYADEPRTESSWTGWTNSWGSRVQEAGQVTDAAEWRNSLEGRP